MFVCSEQCAGKSHNLKTGNISFETVAKFKNLATSCDVTQLFTGHGHLKGFLFRLGVVNGLTCRRCDEEEMHLHVVCN
jgi:hypothetical protein